ncbi:methionyl-tRNA formyltransferase [Anaerotalea alkaliphila]|uniref:Methionyl-tRNA formyltransferase n=1 Tax=Anaerotalea alkaliphila TaxID=2662126 RepID=A0A7X5HUF7_9FIRM|nr:methionyl-tRNA formyltransferase [Anaerotalea alkaliphila]NDL66891.1 methionyl-tRNA formyltransferase [Anaerotalea alkaliphila]
MRIVFMGTPDFSVPTLEALVRSEHQVVGVFTQPDKQKGRGQKLQPTPVKAAALEAGIPVFQPVRIRNREALDQVRALAPDLVVVVAFGQILPKELLEMPPYGCVNVHASLLPKYRGAGPIQWCLLNGEKETGLTTMRMDEGLDTGDMLLKVSVPIREKETGGSLHDRLSGLGGDLLLETIRRLEEGTLAGTPQNPADATYAPLLTKDMGAIDWSLEGERIDWLVRGLDPWPGAYTWLEGKLLKVWDVEVSEEGFDQDPGTVVAVDPKKGFQVACGNNTTLWVKEVQLQGKKRMPCDVFLRGVRLPAGMTLPPRG